MNDFGLVQCLCKNCQWQNECEYYFENIKPVVDVVKDPFYQDEFTIQIREVLERFQCDYFE
jgi:hypothetical protein